MADHKKERNNLIFLYVLMTLGLTIVLTIWGYNLYLRNYLPDQISLTDDSNKVIKKQHAYTTSHPLEHLLGSLTNAFKRGKISVKTMLDNNELDGVEIKLYQAGSDKLVTTLHTGERVDKLFKYYGVYKAVLNYQSNDDAIDNHSETIYFKIDSDIVEIVFWLNRKGAQTDNAGNRGIDTEQSFTLEVPVLLQNPELPNGCEAVSLTSVLQYWQCQLDKMTIVDHYLKSETIRWRNGERYGPDPQLAYVGNPRNSTGWFVYEKPIVEAAKAYLVANDITHLNVEAISFDNIQQIEEQLELGRPVIVWATMDLQPVNYGYSWYLTSTGELFSAAVNLHCKVIYGYDQQMFYVMDPLYGNVQYAKEQLFSSYRQLGSRSIVVY